MQSDGGFKPTEQDFADLSVQIIKFCRDSQKPPTLQVIADFIDRPRAIVEGYCDQLVEAGKIEYVPTGRGEWGYYAAPEK